MRDRIEEWKQQMRAEGKSRPVSPERKIAFERRHDKAMREFVAEFHRKQHASVIEASKHVLND